MLNCYLQVTISINLYLIQAKAHT